MSTKGEISCKDVNVKDQTNYAVFHVKSYIDFDEVHYDERIEDIIYIDLALDYVIAMNELAKYPKKYRTYTSRGKKMVETKLERKQFLQSILKYELENETLD